MFARTRSLCYEEYEPQFSSIFCLECSEESTLLVGIVVRVVVGVVVGAVGVVVRVVIQRGRRVIIGVV